MAILKTYFNAISPLSEATWEVILPLFEKQKLQKHDYFVKQSEVARNIAFLESGVVRAYFVDSAGKEYNKQFFVGHSVIGAYSSLLTKKPNLISQQALTDCVVYACNYDSLVSLFDRFQDLERLVRKMAEYYFIEKERKELEIVLQDANSRYEIFKKEFPALEQLIPQYHVASYLGITPTQLSRIRQHTAGRK
ncbi:MAG: Crp/Fnr family transcriptional regulator [Bacteroidetes bacterium]|nr:Crp/Fnr family transcriptional regulator [Bacteroidota bacterium]